MSKKPSYHELEQRVKELEEESNNLKLIKKELHDKDKHLQSILESADGFAIYQLVVNKNDPHLLRTTFVSPSIRNVLGTEPEDFSSTTFFANIHPDDSARVELANKQAFETNRFDVICRYYSEIKKQWIWIHAISTGVASDKGHITHVNGIFIDITKQKRIEESLQESEEHLRSLMESATNFALFRLINDKTSPHQLKVKFVSPSVKDILGIPEPMKFEAWFKSMHPEDIERIDKASQRAFTTLRFDEEYRTYNPKKAEWRWIHAISTGGVDKNGWNNYVNGILLDVTDRKQAEEKLKEKTDTLKKLNEQIISIEGRERKAVAADLHDSVAQTLAISISKIKTIQEPGAPINLEIIAEIQGQLEQTVREIRSMIYQLSPPVLDDFEIDIALGFLIEQSNEKHDINIKYINNLHGPVYLIEANKSFLYRAINEFIVNIIKHSDSKDAEIEISIAENFILLNVEDNGVGFDLNKFTDQNACGFGIYNISERIKNLGGNFVLFSKPGKGTKISFSIPLSSRKDIENEKRPSRNS